MVYRVGQFLWCKYSQPGPFHLRQLTVELGDAQHQLSEVSGSTLQHTTMRPGCGSQYSRRPSDPDTLISQRIVSLAEASSGIYFRKNLG